MTTTTQPPSMPERLHYLDAVRAFALLLGVVFHACLSFLPYPIGWAVMDVSTSPLVHGFFQVSHSFRMPLFFLIAGFFSHLSFHRKGTGSFLKMRLIRLGIPFVAGWFILWPLIVSGWVMGYASLHGEVNIWTGLGGGFATLKNLPNGIFTQTHLWFLYYLLMITGIVLGLRAITTGLGFGLHHWMASTADSFLARLSQSRWGPVLLVPPTAGLLWFMQGWGLATPDKSLLPDPVLLLLYGGCFGLGWLFHRSPSMLNAFTRLTWERFLVVGISCVATVVFSWIQFDRSHPHYDLARVAYISTYATMMWGCLILTIGLFRRLVRGPSGLIRYLADASYWIYLAHLPVVVWLQVAVAEWPLHWSLKLVVVSVGAALVCLVSYGILVRPTWIGRVLNGPRRQLPGPVIACFQGRSS